MKIWQKTSLALALALCASTGVASLGNPSREQELIRVLSSNASLSEKDAACEQLKTIGSERCVPALAALLSHEQLSHAARYALESMPFPEAGQALIDALQKTSGITEAGIISSLGARREQRAIPHLAVLVDSRNAPVALAAIRALGDIGGLAVVKPLESVARNAKTGVMRDAAIGSMLRCANHLARAGNSPKALEIYRKVHGSEIKGHYRVAAFCGMARASASDDAAELVARALEGPAGPDQLAALQLVREIQSAGVTERLAALLPRLDRSLQAGLLAALTERGDPAAAPAVSSLVSTSESEVRVSALKALGRLGDANAVPLLAEFAAAGSPREQAAARQALVDLRRGRVNETLVTQLANARPEVQAELARALGSRGDRRAIPRLFQLAETGSATARKSALDALGHLAEQAEIPMMIRYVVTTSNAQARTEAAAALNLACQRIGSKPSGLNTQTLLKSILLGSREARMALVPVCSGLKGPEVRTALRSVLQDPEPAVHAVATTALCETIDPDLLEDVVFLAGSTTDQRVRAQAIAAGVRLTADQNTVKISRGQRVAALKTLLAAAQTPEEKNLVIAGLGEMPDFEALRAVDPLLDDPALHGVASQAAIKIATALPGTYARDSMGVLNKALASAPDPATSQALQTALQQLQDSVDYVTDWVTTGPYQQEGKDFSALFDVVFPPETDNAQGVEWKPLPAGTDPKRPYVLDLYKALGGTGRHCVAYARTWLHCEQEQPMRLELGSDDGVRVWINDKQVHSNNTTRRLVPGADNIDIQLHPGWNMLLLKITQNDLRWEFCARLVKPDGTHLDDIQIEAAPRTTTASNP